MESDDSVAAAAVEVQTLRWVESVVVGLGLCPFARAPLEAGALRVVISEARSPEALALDLRDELGLLEGEPPERVETTLLVHPWALQDFADFNDFLGAADALLELLDLGGEIQIASFHPDYRFDGAADDDPANYSNRSPYPMLHLLREASVTRALDEHGAAHEIPDANVARLRSEGLAALQARLAACRREGDEH